MIYDDVKIVKIFQYKLWNAGRHLCWVGLGKDGELYRSYSSEEDKKWLSFNGRGLMPDIKDMVRFAKEFGHLLVFL